MKTKKIFYLILCIAVLFSAIGCRKTNNNLSNSSFSDTLSQESSSEIIDAVQMLYGFKSIKGVDYYCVKNTPNSDIIYSVCSITTDTDKDICDFSTVIKCEDENIKIDDKTIIIPASYAKNKKAVKLTAYHSGVGASYDFTINPDDEWDLVFEDDFDGNELNKDIWNIWDSADWQYFYSPDSVYLDGNGNLINRTSILETPHPEYEYTRKTGAITTKDKYESTYGYYEIRMIPNFTSGMLSAYWLVAGDMSDRDAVDDGSAVNGFEVDIVETYYSRNDPAQTIHWDGYYNDQTKSESFSFSGMEEIFDGNYHTFAFRWSPKEYTFLIDGKVTAKTKKMGICNQPAYLLVSAHFCNAGEMILNPGEYSDMIIDYVKVYSSSNDTK